MLACLSRECTFVFYLCECTSAFSRSKARLCFIDRIAYAFLSIEGTFAFDRAYACSRFIERMSDCVISIHFTKRMHACIFIEPVYVHV